MVSTAPPILLLTLELVHEHGAKGRGAGTPPPLKPRPIVSSELRDVPEHLPISAIRAPAASREPLAFLPLAVAAPTMRYELLAVRHPGSNYAYRGAPVSNGIARGG